MTKNGKQNKESKLADGLQNVDVQKAIKEYRSKIGEKPKGKVQKAVEKYEAKIGKSQDKKGKSSSWSK